MSSFQLYIAVFLLDKGIDPALYCGFYFTYMDILVSPLKKKTQKQLRVTSLLCISFTFKPQHAGLHGFIHETDETPVNSLFSSRSYLCFSYVYRFL